MKGKYDIRVENKRIVYQFSVKRNLTIIRGNSATGKTTLVDMIRNYEQNGEESGITLRCKKSCTVLTDQRWQSNLAEIHDSIVFIDEDYHFIRSEQFAAAVQKSDNYYVLITRDNLYNLPYSVNEIYGIHASGKYSDLRKTYNELYQIYGNVSQKNTIAAQCIISEDSNSGHDFFQAVSSKNSDCISAGGKSNIYKNDHNGECVMLSVHFGDVEHEVYNPSVYFNNQYEDNWITSDFSKKMIMDVDRSKVIDARIIDSPFLGPITPRELSGGVKTLILLANDTSGKIFNGSACGNNCAKWILKIAEKKDVTIALHNIMDFGDGPFMIKVLNNGKLVHNRLEYVQEAVRWISAGQD